MRAVSSVVGGLWSTMSTHPLREACTVDERVYWNQDPFVHAQCSQLSDMYYMVTPGMWLATAIATSAEFPISPDCVYCLIEAEFCNRRVRNELARVRPEMAYGSAADHELDRVCVTQLMECSGGSSASELPRYWEDIVQRPVRPVNELPGAVLYYAYDTARYNKIDSFGRHTVMRTVMSGGGVDRPTKDELEHVDIYGKSALDYAGVYPGGDLERGCYSIASMAHTHGIDILYNHGLLACSSAMLPILYSSHPPPVHWVDSSVGNSMVHRVIEDVSLADEERAQLIAWLLENGANRNLQGRGGNTPLMLAASFQRPNSIEVILSGNVDLEIVNDEGMTALMIAASGNNVDIAKMILDAGASINFASPRSGWTAVMFAATYSRIIMFDYLVERKAKPPCLVGTGMLEDCPDDLLREVLDYSSPDWRISNARAPFSNVPSDSRLTVAMKFGFAHPEYITVGVQEPICPLAEWTEASQKESLLDSHRRCRNHVDELVCLAERIPEVSVGCLACFHGLVTCERQRRICLSVTG